MAFADEDGPAFIVGAFQTAVAAGRIVDKLTEAFRTGEGVGWHEHDHGVFHGVERFFRSSYLGNLIQAWIPALDGMEAKLRAGARVADIGCGHGASTIIMAQAYPNSRFVGFDSHPESIDAANARARKAGIADRCRFEVAGAKNFPGTGYDLVTVFDALHDMGDPAGAARHVLSTLAPGGSWMIVEPYAGDRVEENLNPVGRAYYAASTLICTPCSLAQEVGLALGAQAGEGAAARRRAGRRLHDVPPRRAVAVQPGLRSEGLTGPAVVPVTSSWPGRRSAARGDGGGRPTRHFRPPATTRRTGPGRCRRRPTRMVPAAVTRLRTSTHTHIRYADKPPAIAASTASHPSPSSSRGRATRYSREAPIAAGTAPATTATRVPVHPLALASMMSSPQRT